MFWPSSVLISIFLGQGWLWYHVCQNYLRNTSARWRHCNARLPFLIRIPSNCRFAKVEGDIKRQKVFTISNPIGASKPPAFLQRWNTKTFTLEQAITKEGSLSAIAVSDNGNFVAIGTMFDGTIEIYTAFNLQVNEPASPSFLDINNKGDLSWPPSYCIAVSPRRQLWSEWNFSAPQGDIPGYVEDSWVPGTRDKGLEKLSCLTKSDSR